MAAMKYKNFHQTNMLCYAILLCYVDGGFSSVSTLQHTMLITSRQIVNLSIIKHSLSFLCKILLTQSVSISQYNLCEHSYLMNTHICSNHINCFLGFVVLYQIFSLQLVSSIIGSICATCQYCNMKQQIVYVF